MLNVLVFSHLRFTDHDWHFENAYVLLCAVYEPKACDLDFPMSLSLPAPVLVIALSHCVAQQVCQAHT